MRGKKDILEQSHQLGGKEILYTSLSHSSEERALWMLLLEGDGAENGSYEV